MLREHPLDYLGNCKGETELPILIKFIDAKKDLSVQVHPTDDYAKEHENGQLGKTEMVRSGASKDAKLIYGRARTVPKKKRAIKDSDCEAGHADETTYSKPGGKKDDLLLFHQGWYDS